MKKILLTLGTSVVAIAPIMTLVACGDKTEKTDKKDEDNTTSNGFKLGTRSISGNTLSFEIEANESEIKKFEEKDVTAALDSIIKDLIINFYNIDENDQKNDEILNATAITFDHQIAFSSETKASSKATLVTINVSDIDDSCDSIRDLKVKLDGGPEKNDDEIGTKAFKDLTLAIGGKLYALGEETNGKGYKFESFKMDENKLIAKIKTEKILLDLFSLREVQSAEMIIEELAKDIKANLIKDNAEIVSATNIVFQVQFKDNNDKIDALGLWNKNIEYSMKDLSSNPTADSSYTLEKLKEELSGGNAAAVTKKVITKIKEALTKKASDSFDLGAKT